MATTKYNRFYFPCEMQELIICDLSLKAESYVCYFLAYWFERRAMYPQPLNSIQKLRLKNCLRLHRHSENIVFRVPVIFEREPFVLSSKKLNKLIHTLNGNPPKRVKFSKKSFSSTSSFSSPQQSKSASQYSIRTILSFLNCECQGGEKCKLCFQPGHPRTNELLFIVEGLLTVGVPITLDWEKTKKQIKDMGIAVGKQMRYNDAANVADANLYDMMDLINALKHKWVFNGAYRAYVLTEREEVLKGPVVEDVSDEPTNSTSSASSSRSSSSSSKSSKDEVSDENDSSKHSTSAPGPTSSPSPIDSNADLFGDDWKPTDDGLISSSSDDSGDDIDNENVTTPPDSSSSSGHSSSSDSSDDDDDTKNKNKNKKQKPTKPTKSSKTKSKFTPVKPYALNQQPQAVVFTIDPNSGIGDILRQMFYGAYLLFKRVINKFTTFIPIPQFIINTFSVRKLKSAAPKVVDKGDLAVYDIEFAEYNILELEDESLITFLTRRTPEFDADFLSEIHFIKKTDDLVLLPSTMVDEFVHFWVNHPHNEASMLLCKHQMSQWLHQTVGTAFDQGQALMFGPLITFYHYYITFYKQSDSFRRERKRLTTKINIMRSEWTLTILQGTIFVTGVITLIYKYRRLRSRTANNKRIEDFNRSENKRIDDFIQSELARQLEPSNKLQQKFIDQPNIYNNKKYVATSIPKLLVMPKPNEEGYTFQVPELDMDLPEGTTMIATRNKLNPEQIIPDTIWQIIYSKNTVPEKFELMAHEIRSDPIVTGLFYGPIVEEIMRTLWPEATTTYLITQESLFYGNPYTAPLHLFNYSVTKFMNRIGAPKMLTWFICFLIHRSWNFEAMTKMGFPQANVFSVLENVKYRNTFPSYPSDKVVVQPPARLKFGARVSPQPMRESLKEKEAMTYLYGFGDKNYRPVVYSAGPDNEKAALEHRVLKATPVPDLGYMYRFEQFVKTHIHQLLPKTFKSKIKTPPFEEYLRRSNAKPGVKRKLKRVKEELDREQVFDDSVLSSKQLKKYTVREAFPKVEQTNHRSGGIHKIKAPRLIQGASAKYICLTAPWTMSFQDHIKRDLNKNNFACFTSGVSTKDAANVLTGITGRMFENDVSGWDVSYCIWLCLLEIWIYQFFGAPRAIIDLMYANLKTHGVTMTGFLYWVLGTRKSGEPFTSVLNSLMNFLIHCFGLHVFFGWTVQQMRICSRMVVQGDDNAMNHLDMGFEPDWYNHMLKLGFESESIYRKHWDDVEFCSMRLYPVEGGYCFGPKIGKVLSKIGYFTEPPIHVRPEVLLRGTALGLINTCSFLAPLKIVIEKFLELTDGFVAKPMYREEWQMRFSKCKPSYGTLTTLYNKYGWTENTAKYFQEEIDKCKMGTDVIGPVFRYFCDADTAGVPMRIWI